MKWLTFTCLVLTTSSLLAQTDELKTDKEKQSYAIGVSIGRNLGSQGLDIDLNVLLRGMSDAIGKKKPLLTDEQMTAAFRALEQQARAKAEAQMEQLKKDNATYLVDNAKKEGVVVTKSGLQYKVLKSGDGEKPKLTDKVQMHYAGRLIDGTEFDSSYKRKMPISVSPQGGVIEGWLEALKMMRVGDKWELTIPYNLAYGERGSRGAIPPFATLIFEIEMVGIE